MSMEERTDPAQAIADLRRSLEVPEALAAVGGDGLQVDVGGYQIFQTDTTGPLIAELFVEVDGTDPSNDKLRIEHWGLYPSNGWVTASASNPSPRPLALQRLNGTMWGSSGDFRKYLRNKAATTRVTYIQARCETMDP